MVDETVTGRTPAAAPWAGSVALRRAVGNRRRAPHEVVQQVLLAQINARVQRRNPDNASVVDTKRGQVLGGQRIEERCLQRLKAEEVVLLDVREQDEWQTVTWRVNRRRARGLRLISASSRVILIL